MAVSRGADGAMRIEGGCHCGAIAFAAAVDPDNVRICHCTDCQTLTGSAYRANVPALAGTFVLRRGAPKIYVKTAESGTRRAHAFCPECGTPIYSATLGEPASYSLRLGTLKERASLVPKRQIWCRSALPWAMDLHRIAKIDRQ